MCGRFNIRATPTELQEYFDLLREPDPYPIRYNVAPTQTILAIRQTDEGRVALPHHWGLILSWSDPKKAGRMINARGETVAEKPAYRSAFKKRRCLIPVSGFYEWEQISSKQKQPWHITRQDRDPIAIASLFEVCERTDLGHTESCCLITTDPNEVMAQFHDRMPVILGRSDWDVWLDPDVPADALQSLIRPCPAEWITAERVNPIVNNARNETPDCIKPADRGLFDEA